ncbi:uncharacterized protein LOC128893038 isoform X1 [Hylaeus anthracinus]|uniref:uncharacterized protein LOC128893038 isoform X1 n=2 Tax=Hylaeus anthracinus TaxID=313031 RepID=UPI0023B964E8|nr:uncharacterized protein LOC128893038 isoform X1 [Hylaeus anthracinus]
MQMHPRALYLFALVLSLAGCEEKARWYSGLQTVLKNCPVESWNNPGQDDFLEKFRRCVQDRALAALDSLLEDDVIPVFDGLDLVRFQEKRINSTGNHMDSEPEDETNWTSIIVKRLLRVLRTHVFKIDIDHIASNITSPASSSKMEVENNIFEGRRRRLRRRHQHMMPLMLMGFLLMGSIFIPMGFQFLAVLGGKALLLAKMALILSSIQGLKKIATNGVNYGLYHVPPVHDHGWHERSHIEPPPHHMDLPFQHHSPLLHP